MPTPRLFFPGRALLCAAVVLFVWMPGCRGQGLITRKNLGASGSAYDKMRQYVADAGKWRALYNAHARDACSARSGSLCASAGGDAEKRMVLMLATSPTVYDSRTRIPHNPLKAPFDQRGCAMCVSAAVTAAGVAAASIGLQVSASELDMSAGYLHYCANTERQLTCTTGWDIEPAAQLLGKARVLPSSCLSSKGDTFGVTDRTRICQVSGSCSPKYDPFALGKFSYTVFDTIWDAQDHIRRYGAVVTQMDLYFSSKPDIKYDLQAFYKANLGSTPYKASPNVDKSNSQGHAVLLVGYDNARELWLVQNSWGPGFADNGCFWVPFNEAGIGPPGAMFGIKFLPFKPQPLKLTKRPAANKPGCVQYKTKGGDYLWRISSEFFDVSIDKLMLDNVGTVDQLNSQVPTGTWLTVCGAQRPADQASGGPPPQMQQPSSAAMALRCINVVNPCTRRLFMYSIAFETPTGLRTMGWGMAKPLLDRVVCFNTTNPSGVGLFFANPTNHPLTTNDSAFKPSAAINWPGSTSQTKPLCVHGGLGYDIPSADSVNCDQEGQRRINHYYVKAPSTYTIDNCGGSEGAQQACFEIVNNCPTQVLSLSLAYDTPQGYEVEGWRSYAPVRVTTMNDRTVCIMTSNTKHIGIYISGFGSDPAPDSLVKPKASSLVNWPGTNSPAKAFCVRIMGPYQWNGNISCSGDGQMRVPHYRIRTPTVYTIECPWTTASGGQQRACVVFSNACNKFQMAGVAFDTNNGLGTQGWLTVPPIASAIQCFNTTNTKELGVAIVPPEGLGAALIPKSTVPWPGGGAHAKLLCANVAGGFKHLEAEKMKCDGEGQQRVPFHRVKYTPRLMIFRDCKTVLAA